MVSPFSVAGCSAPHQPISRPPSRTVALVPGWTHGAEQGASRARVVQLPECGQTPRPRVHDVLLVRKLLVEFVEQCERLRKPSLLEKLLRLRVFLLGLVGCHTALPLISEFTIQRFDE